MGQGNFWLSGRDMQTMIIHGFMSKIWVMPKRLYRHFSVRNLGRFEPEGGVVLGLHLRYDIIMTYDFLVLLCINIFYIYFYYIILIC